MEPIHIGDNGPQLPCKFYDLPGLDDVETIRINEIKKIINGERRIDVQVITLILLHALTFNSEHHGKNKYSIFVVL